MQVEAHRPGDGRLAEGRVGPQSALDAAGRALVLGRRVTDRQIRRTEAPGEPGRRPERRRVAVGQDPADRAVVDPGSLGQLTLGHPAAAELLPYPDTEVALVHVPLTGRISRAQHVLRRASGHGPFVVNIDRSGHRGDVPGFVAVAPGPD
jgi:hypothetical protein